MKPEQMVEQVKDVVPGIEVALDSEIAAQFWGQDSFIVRIAPKTENEAGLILHAANEQGWSVFPYGGGTQLGCGDALGPVDIILESRKLNRIVEYSPADMVITVQTGVKFSHLQDVLKEEGQMLPIDPVCSPDSTIGGLLATAPSGPMQIAYGTLRDMTIGVHVVYPDGRLIKTGGKVVKNVAGYDMVKLFVGSHGTLGFLTEASFKLRPLPLSRALVVAGGTLEASQEFFKNVINSNLVPSRIEILFGSYPFTHNGKWYVAVDCNENSAACEFQRNTLYGLAANYNLSPETYMGNDAEEFWASYRKHLHSFSLILRYSLQPKDIIEASERIRILVQGHDVDVQFSVSAARGVGRVYCSELSLESESSIVQEVRALLEPYNGVAIIENASVALRSREECLGVVRSDFRLMKQIKNSIDPNWIMSPGRVRGIETLGDS